MSISNRSRSAAMREVTHRPVRITTRPDSNGVQQPTSVWFGMNTFGLRDMRAKLPKDVYKKLAASIRLGKKLDSDIAPVVAQVIKEWALSRGVTHFTHWFQPQTGLTAEKHDAFLNFDENKLPMETFTGEQLIQSEPDASSFPSGGLRATWEARGYTAWNPGSPVFISETGGVKYLCIPSVFIGYNGEALDEMTPLLRSSDVLSAATIKLLELMGDTGVLRVNTTLGVEQEFFLIDRAHFALRPDLVMANRSLVGAPPPRGQQLEDHYFGGIPERVQACISEVEHELYKLGVPIVTRHNEVAPSQFEMAPIFEDSDIAVDHNHLTMAVLRKVALRHGLQAIVHEKPFAGINGSGKHCNWSLAITSDNNLDGTNLLKPGKTPHQNLRFLIILAAVLKGVHKHAGLLRAGIATSGNEHRLGANEAPPAIISAFLGKGLTQVIEDIAGGKTSPANAEQAMLKLGVAKLPEVEQDNTDRNRTSPFAFTGAKFEFRAVGGSQSIAFPVMLLQAGVAEAVIELTEALAKEIKTAKSTDDAVLKVVRKAFKETTAVRFEGNNYSDEWVVEAKSRGLLNLRRTPEAMAELKTDSAKALFKGTGILTDVELESRYHVRLERYVKDILIELHTLQQMIDTQVLPASYAYLAQLAGTAGQGAAAGINMQPVVDAANATSKLVAAAQKKRAELAKVITKAEALHDDLDAQAVYLTSTGCDALAEVRETSDALELAIGDEFWPLPRYREMLFPV
ncbi:glutamine synthetase type III [Gemmatimonas aurantiaca T-27]|uniref:Glutamine synthetase type III n=2 Tax=Gemmatimonas aurantiaca TaxID=173480 RepID=C1A4X6_GEMAT|nr:glutamine synthetase III [Gemmatimonas aurantiaca]BAH37286.1 glutamine synthetase type III [Gemmatimonas aurantiaca T-27]